VFESTVWIAQLGRASSDGLFKHHNDYWDRVPWPGS